MIANGSSKTMIAEVLRAKLNAHLSLPAILAEGAARSAEGMLFLESDGTSRALPLRGAPSPGPPTARRAAGPARG